MIQQNSLTRVLIRKTSAINTGYSLLNCVGIDSLGYSQDKEFIKVFSNGKLVPVGIVTDAESNWEAEITTYVGMNDFLPLNDLNCTYDMLVLYGTCRNPLDVNEYASGIFLRDVVFTSIANNQISPIESGELAVIKKNYSLISANASILTHHKQIIDASHTFQTGIFRKDCEIEYILFENDIIYLSNGDNRQFILDNNAAVFIVNKDNTIFIASGAEFVITNFDLSADARILSSISGNFTSLVYNSNKLYFTTDAGEIGYLDIINFTETILYVGTYYSDIIFINSMPIALGTDGIYIDGLVRNGFHIDSAIVFNDSVIFTNDTLIAMTNDLFGTTKPIGKLPEQFSKLVNYNGIFYGLGISGKVYMSLSRGFNWSRAKLENINSLVDNYAIGNGVFVQ